MKSLKITKGWFYGAGSPKMYNWVKDGYDIFGVGISLDFLKETEEVEIVVEGKPYQLKTMDAVNFARRYGTEKVMGSGTHIIVVSKSLLSPTMVLESIEV